MAPTSRRGVTSPAPRRGTAPCVPAAGRGRWWRAWMGGGVLVLAVALACAPPARGAGEGRVPGPFATPSADDTLSRLVPVGFGTLRQDDIALRVSQFGLQVRAIPLDETVIRVLSPDSYRALRELVSSQRVRLEEVRRRTALPGFSLWYVSFFGVEQGESRFSPMEFIITNVGRDFRPVDVIPLSPGFGTQRLRQREVQHALFAFDGQVDVNQPLVVTYETVRNTDWPAVLQRIERERALVRSRARGQESNAPR